MYLAEDDLCRIFRFIVVVKERDMALHDLFSVNVSSASSFSVITQGELEERAQAAPPMRQSRVAVQRRATAGLVSVTPIESELVRAPWPRFCLPVQS